MKIIAKIVKGIQVEAPVVNFMFVAYFILLAATAMLVVNHSQHGSDSVEITETTSEKPSDFQIKN
ncbi:MAG: hypothetical protein EOP49_00290 [Sphingobacteriales bacterium]|nr:MAG: hypothetical protein EOP49_00290 [Sphingobacteriales bacterium]